MEWNQIPAVQYADLAEYFVERYLNKTRGYTDILKKGDRPSVVDFVFADKDGNIAEIAEVKAVKTAYSQDGICPYAFSIRAKTFENCYLPLIDERLPVPFKLYILDARACKIFVQDFATLEDGDYYGGWDETIFYDDRGKEDCFFPCNEHVRFTDEYSDTLRHYPVQAFEELVDFSSDAELVHVVQKRARAVKALKFNSGYSQQFISPRDIISLVHGEA